jgi:hypothetical protein
MYLPEIIKVWAALPETARVGNRCRSTDALQQKVS